MVWNKQSIDLLRIINSNKLKIIAEVGVWKGHTTRNIIYKCDIDEMWAIDIWGQTPTSSHRYRGRSDWDDLYNRLCIDMVSVKSLRVLRLLSCDAAKLFKDNYFDLVFVDCDHSYESVLEDIGLWLPLVKPGGFLTGHDYGTHESDRKEKHPGVRKAVDEYFGKDNIDVFLPGCVWCYRK